MSVIDPQSAGTSSLVARVKAILISPAHEWDVIDGEPATVKGLYTGYVCILAAIPPLAGLIGSFVFGRGTLGLFYRPPIGALIAGAVVGYVMSLVGVFVLALVIDALAPSFEGTKNQIQALKISAYAGTAGWVAGVFAIYPALVFLSGLGALYGLYLLYLGLPKLMKVHHDKALAYTLVTIVVAIVVFIVIGEMENVVYGAAYGVGHIGGPGFT